VRVLITGGAGFIGSHLADAMRADGNEVVVLDDLTTGFREHVAPDVELVEGSVADMDVVRRVVRGADIVLHHAAARAVARSVEDPVSTDRVNTGGTLNVLVAARDEGVRRVVVASSSSVYGGVAPQPTPEEAELTPKSPYAVSKAAGEQYARVFWELFGLETVRLRYFNVFGPRQRPDSPYAAVIPLFAEAILDRRQPEIHGDGLQSRDFTYIDDVVEANRRAISAPSDVVAGKVYNIAQGKSTTILGLWEELARIAGSELEPSFTSPRPGDVRSSLASIETAVTELGFVPRVGVSEGLERVWAWISDEGPTLKTAAPP
jgi:UDP-glucose 4-epimerase